MNIFVVLKMVPDTVEELNVSQDGKSLDSEFLRFKLNDPDEHALEQALILKEKCGGKVTVIALDAPEVDDVLYTALAKGADRAVKIPVSQACLGTKATAKVLSDFFSSGREAVTLDTLVLAGSYAIDDLEGELAPMLAVHLGLPYLGVVSNVAASGPGLVVQKEFAGGLRGEFEVELPAVLGIQSAEKPPRYVPVAKVRAVMKSAKIEELEIPSPTDAVCLDVQRTYKPEAGGRAEIFEGSPEEIADKIVDALAKSGVI
ncbi:MAG: electron transfer flavoprotein subunit beta/FixA family protein [Verrucomicrobiota bacterium]|nr:electron transfer flavoprotein subunit beta/FixA family protein [Verrucomicrobiota bacterium]